MASVDEDVKKQIIDTYVSAGPTPETSMDIVNDIAKEFDRSPNSIRMLLTQADVYVKKTTVTKTATDAGKGETKASKKSKQDSLDDLSKAIVELGHSADDTIISKMTGKAAEYFITILTSLKK